LIVLVIATWYIALILDSMALSQTLKKLQDQGHGTSVAHGVPVYLPVNAGVELYCLVTVCVCVNNLPVVAVDSAAAG